MKSKRSVKNAIATPNKSATQIANGIYADGGNAIDAAVAASFALAVSYPHNTSIGGDLIALVRAPDGQMRCFNASGPAGASVKPRSLRSRYGTSMPTYGIDTVTVPGMLSGLDAIHAAAGHHPWEKLVMPAADLAQKGTPVTSSLAAAIKNNQSALHSDPGMRSILAPEGTPLTAGASLKQPALATTLRQIADGGSDAFYRGPIGTKLIQGLQSIHCDLTEDDLYQYQSTETDVLTHLHDGHAVHTSGLNTQGILLPQMLGASAYLPDSKDTAALARLWIQINRNRDRHLSDPEYSNVSESELLDESYLRDMARNAQLDRVQPDAETFAQPKGDTVAVVATDAEGYAACLIHSVFHPFGARILEPETGILLHNRGAFFSLDPAHANVIEPGKRPGHTLMPVMVTRDGQLRWVIGTMGGKAQPQVHFQILSHLLQGDSPDEAVNRARWIVGGLGAHDPQNALYCESNLSSEIQQKLETSGFDMTVLEPLSELLGHANIVAIGQDGTLSASSDPRSDGAEPAIL